MEDWSELLINAISKKPFFIIQFSNKEWNDLMSSYGRLRGFTIVRRKDEVSKLAAPVACLLLGGEREQEVFIGLVERKLSAATLDASLRISNISPIIPRNRQQLLTLPIGKLYIEKLREKIQTTQASQLSPGLSKAILGQLLASTENQKPLERISRKLLKRKNPKPNLRMQEDAVRTALGIFGITSNDTPYYIYIKTDDETALGDAIPVFEDNAISHDAFDVPEYNIQKHELTGKATSIKDDKVLEVFTANRTNLEKVFGVDLIYLNVSKQNVVMLQYKMLDQSRDWNDQGDWIFVPTDHFYDEVERMRRFCEVGDVGKYEYRFNSEVFYLKFVKRDAHANDNGIIIPLSHFDIIKSDPTHRGTRGGIRISYNKLSGRYLRHGSFIDLMSSGYIGSHEKATRSFKKLISLILGNGKSVVAAIEQAIDPNFIKEEQKSSVSFIPPLNSNSDFDDLPF